jgi:anti-sigma factor RsiW
MSDEELEKIKSLLKEAYVPLQNAEPRRDLWPEMQDRLKRRAMRVPWWDWALLAAASVMTLLFPGVIPALLYHL